MFIFFIFFLGLFTGSFLGVLIDRIPQGKPFLAGRSYCDFCQKTLSWFDLIPVLSFVLLKGKCRYCGVKLPYFYPIIEIITGVMFVLTYLFLIFNLQFSIYNELFNFQFPEFIELLYYLFIVSALIVIFFTDLKYGIIPDKIIFPAILITVFWLFLNPKSLIINHVLSGAGSFLFLLAIPSLYYLFTKKVGMGGGDIKFAFLMGLILGFPLVLVSFYTAFLTGAVISIILILWKKKTLATGKIAFGPFLVFGTLLGLYLGNQISLYLMRLFGI